MSQNLRAPAVTVAHAELLPASDESPFRKKCPVCKVGVLMVHREQKTFMLVNVDCCTLCGQTVIYSDTVIGGEPVMDIRPS